MRSTRIAALAFAAIVRSLAADPAAGMMPAAQQNGLVRKYCAVCHTDAAKNGGLSLEHFDAAGAPPSLTAMLLSKLTGGVPLETMRQAQSDPAAAEIIGKQVNSGAIRAAGLPIPDKPAVDAWIRTFAVETAGAAEWTVQRTNASVTASILREAPSANNAGEAEAYRLIVSCSPAAGRGEIQLAWSPAAQTGIVSVSVDGAAARQYRVEGSESMGNGNGAVLHNLAAVTLAGLPIPTRSLKVTDLFPGQTITFPSLPGDAQRDFQVCFQP